ncbi:MAG: hypothetical protein JJE03_07130 [Peptostreptococcaceae bacterium]|nr:hypothetical protein [Peptostreptococcaceae bacterium]
MKFVEFINKENITLAIAILSLAGSLSSWMYNLHRQKKSFEVNILSKTFTNKSLILYLAFINKSALPLSITRVTVCFDTLQVDSNNFKNLIHRSKTSSSNTENFNYSLELPIHLPPLDGISGHLVFQPIETITSSDIKNIKLVIYTNRGKPVTLKKSLPDKDAFNELKNSTF